MSSLPRFQITPGSAKAPTPVALSLPPHYTARAAITDVCGKPIPGGHLTYAGHGLVAAPQLPSSFTGTFFITWKIAPAGQHPGLGTTMTLASRQQQGHATSCPGPNPYQSVAAPVSHALVVRPAAPGSFPVLDVAGGGIILAVVIIAALAWRRLTRHTGSRAAR